jgi:hypothetical protein
MYLAVDHVDERVRARRENEYQPRAALARKTGSSRVGPIAESLDHGLHMFDGAGSHPRATMQHAVHSGKADTRSAGHVMQAGTFGMRHPFIILNEVRCSSRAPV